MMKKICLALTIVKFVAAMCPGVQVMETGGITCQIQKDIVNIHNEFRNSIAKGVVGHQPPASNMREMYWDDELAETAQNWANHCRFQHNSASERKVARFQVGQNIARTRSGAMMAAPVMEFQQQIKNWFNENVNYNFGSVYGNQQNVGHYTQIAWADTYLVGCGYSRFKDASTTYDLYVCNYGPAGNMLGSEPYKVGNKRSCSANFVFSNNYQRLCSPSETPLNSCESYGGMNTIYRRTLDEPTSDENYSLDNTNSDDNGKSKNDKDKPPRSLLRDIIWSMRISL